MSNNPRPAVQPGSRTPIPARDCAHCGRPIPRPTRNQKVHSGRCRAEWNVTSTKELRKRRAAMERKNARRRIGAFKRTKPVRDPKYLAWIRTLDCMLCSHYGIRQSWPTEAAHSGPHGISQKAPDTSALPLCTHCHRSGPGSYHAIGRHFFETHELKPREELVAAYNLAFAELQEGE